MGWFRGRSNFLLAQDTVLQCRVEEPELSNWGKYRRYISILFGVSLVGLALHALDDAYVTGEPNWYGVPPEEFLIVVALIYLIVPPIGLWLLRRGQAVGFIIVAGYAFQALYGAGINHVRHLYGNFSGSQLLPTILTALKIDYSPWLATRGITPLLLNMIGLGNTPPHSHTTLSNIVVFSNIAINLTLFYFLFLAARELWLVGRLATESIGNPRPGQQTKDHGS